MFESFTELLLDRATKSLELRAVELDPARFSAETERRGEKVTLSSRAWEGRNVRRVRIAHVTSPSVFEAWNLLIIPTPRTGAPIFGAQLLAMSGRAHLGVIDPQNLRPDSPAWQARWLGPFECLRVRYADVSTPEDMPAWTRTFFSPSVFHLKPVGDRLGTYRDAFEHYLATYLEIFRATKFFDPRTEVAEIEVMSAAHRAYHRDHLQHEPAVKSLSAMFGAEFGSDYARTFLFDDA